MSQPQIATLEAQISNDQVVLRSTHAQLVPDELGWIFTILDGAPTTVVFEVKVLQEPSCINLVRSQAELPEGGFDDWVDWTGQGATRGSMPLSDGEALRLDIELGDGTETARGGGYFRVKEEGGGPG